MGLFDNSKKEEQRQFKEQLQRQDESNEAQQSMQMAERGAVAFEPQVSAMLLKNGSKLLKWKEDFDNNILVLEQEDFGLEEPFGDEQFAFLDKSRGETSFCASASQTLRAIKLHRAKYGADDNGTRLFNDISGAYKTTIVLSRADGKPQKLAKSQYVESSSYIRRGVDDKKKSNKLFGFL